MIRRTAIALGLALFAATNLAAQSLVTGFNDADIRWYSYQNGLEQATSDCKPVYILFHTTWCPHCKRFRKAFYQPSIVKLSKDFVFIIVDRDEQPDINGRYGAAGGYVPRSAIVDQSGGFQTQLTGSHPDYKYFLNPDDFRDLRSFLTRAKAAFDPAACAFSQS